MGKGVRYHTQRSCLFCDLLCLILLLWKVEGYWHEQVVLALKHDCLLETINSLWGTGFSESLLLLGGVMSDMYRSCSGKHVFCEFTAATAMSWPEDSVSQQLSPPLFTSPSRKESQAINSYAPMLLGNKQHKDTLCRDRTVQIHGNTGQPPGGSGLLSSK